MAEENSYQLFELGAQGLNFIDQNTFECFVNCDSPNLQAFLKNAEELGIKITNQEAVPENNWMEKCQEVWQPVQIEGLKIIPVLDSNQVEGNKEKGSIYIIPGEGFGTGHHDTTRFVTELIQEISSSNYSPKNALDVGCGSGILSLAISDVFGCRVDAIDNDPIALKNADNNIRLNSAKGIHTSTTDIAELKGEYDLIAANIYAEVLIMMKSQFARLLAKPGYLILSGIMSHLSGQVLQNFSDPDWKLLKKLDSGNWVALLLTNKP